MGSGGWPMVNGECLSIIPSKISIADGLLQKTLIWVTPLVQFYIFSISTKTFPLRVRENILRLGSVRNFRI